jgi:hypothetical protein
MDVRECDSWLCAVVDIPGTELFREELRANLRSYKIPTRTKEVTVIGIVQPILEYWVPSECLQDALGVLAFVMPPEHREDETGQGLLFTL